MKVPPPKLSRWMKMQSASRLTPIPPIPPMKKIVDNIQNMHLYSFHRCSNSMNRSFKISNAHLISSIKMATEPSTRRYLTDHLRKYRLSSRSWISNLQKMISIESWGSSIRMTMLALNSRSLFMCWSGM
jgi:hypothetical protein